MTYVLVNRDDFSVIVEGLTKNQAHALARVYRNNGTYPWAYVMSSERYKQNSRRTRKAKEK